MSSTVNRRANHHSDVVSSSVAADPHKVRLRQVEEAPAAKFTTSAVNAPALAAELRRRVRGADRTPRR